MKQIYVCEEIQQMDKLEKILNTYNSLSKKMKLYEMTLTSQQDVPQVTGEMSYFKLINASLHLQMIVVQEDMWSNKSLNSVANIIDGLDSSFTAFPPSIRRELSVVGNIIEEFVMVLDFIISCISKFLGVCPKGQKEGHLALSLGFCCCTEEIVNPFLTTTREPYKMTTREPYTMTTREPYTMTTRESYTMTTREPNIMARRERLTMNTREPYTMTTREPYSMTTREPYTKTTREPYILTTRTSYTMTTREPYTMTSREPYTMTTREPYTMTTREPYSMTTTTTTTKKPKEKCICSRLGNIEKQNL